MNSTVFPFPAPMPIPAFAPSGREDGGAVTPGSPEPFQAELADLAKHHAAELRMITAFTDLCDLIEKVRGDTAHRSLDGIRAVGQAMLDPLLDLRESLETRIEVLAERSAQAEAIELERDFRAMPHDDAVAEFRQLRPDQKAALLWAQAKALAAVRSLVTAIGGDGEPPEAA